MIIKLLESKLFTVDPAIRFADAYKVSPEIFRELWKRYKILQYSIPELCEVYYIQVGQPFNRRKMDEWMFRGEIYSKALDKMKLGAKMITSDTFGEYEQRLINNLFRHVKSGETNEIKSLA